MTMLTESCVPFMTFFAYIIMRRLGVWWDKYKARKLGAGTAAVTIEQYVDIYAGTKVLIFYRYSTIMN